MIVPSNRQTSGVTIGTGMLDIILLPLFLGFLSTRDYALEKTFRYVKNRYRVDETCTLTSPYIILKPTRTSSDDKPRLARCMAMIPHEFAFFRTAINALLDP